MKTITLLACIALMSFCLPNGKSEKLRILSHHRIPILEPSDMCLSTDRQTAYVVSDNGVLYHTDLMGANPQKVGPLGYDFEGVFAANGKVYVSEERTRKIIVIDEATGLQSAVYTVPYNGGRNKGIESITYNAAKKCMIAITEKSPTKLYEFNENFNVKNEIELDFFRDVSSATYFASKLWVLSDEDHSVARLNPETYAVEKIWPVDIINPEGIFFNEAGKLFLVSDDMAQIFEIESENLLN